MPRLGCVAFDLDDTLYLERDYVRSGFRATGEWAARHLGVEGFDERAWRAFDAGVRGNVFDHVLAEYGLGPDSEVVADLVRVYRTHDPAIRLLRDAACALEELSGGVALACVSDGPVESQRAKARALNTPCWATATILTAELGEGFGKPHSRAFAEVERFTDTHGAECAYVADNPNKDFGGPRQLGWRTVRVCRPGSLHAAVPSGPDVDFELETLAPLPDWVG